jgi:hypothetical protein
MATRSRIGIVNDNGTVTSIYCHWDGYPDHNGAILVEHYNTESKIRELMDLGCLSILGEVIGEKCDFNSFNSQHSNQCLAYGRDRGETNIDAVTHSNIAKFLSYGEAYNYLWHNNHWTCTDFNGEEHDLYVSVK